MTQWQEEPWRGLTSKSEGFFEVNVGCVLVVAFLWYECIEIRIQTYRMYTGPTFIDYISYIYIYKVALDDFTYLGWWKPTPWIDIDIKVLEGEYGSLTVVGDKSCIPHFKLTNNPPEKKCTCSKFIVNVYVYKETPKDTRSQVMQCGYPSSYSGWNK